MRRLILCLAMTGLLASGRAAYAQAEARAAFDAGRQAFSAGQFDKAREHFLSASRTDTKNPEVFLWLGRASYELGMLDEAVEAWKTTLQLAPNEPYAGRMIAALRGEAAKIDNLSALVDVLLRERLFEPALRHVDRLLDDKALTDQQRAKALLQKAGALVGLNRAAEAVTALHDAMVRFPKAADPAQTALLLGQAYLRMRGEQSREGLALLRKVTTDYAASASATVAQYELIAADLERGPTAERVDAMAKWIAANPQHALANAARRQLVDASLAVAAQAAPVAPDAPPAKEDLAAISAAADLYRQVIWPADAEAVTRKLLAHIESRYAKAGAHLAAVAAMDAVLKCDLPRSSRIIALRAAASCRAEAALAELGRTIAAKAGADLKPDMPRALADVVAVLDAINQEYPHEGAWKERTALAERVRQLAAQAAWPPAAAVLKPPLAWAVAIALPAAGCRDDAAAQQAITTISAVAAEAAALREPPSRGLGVGVSAQLLSAIPPDSARWLEAAWRHADLLDALARVEFDDNTRAGNAAANSRPSAAQQQMLETLGAILSRQAAAAPKAAEKVTAHLKPWTAQGHYAVGEQMLDQLAGPLPPIHQKSLRLASARLRTMEVIAEHERLLTAGTAPPRNLDARLGRVLERLYVLQADLSESDPLIVDIRRAVSAVVNHYRRLEYFDIARQAIETRPAMVVPAANAFAALQLAHLRQEMAQRELKELVRQHDGPRRLALTAAYRDAIGAYEQFITDYPASPHVNQAAESILNIARAFEQHQAYDVAAEVYRGFAAFAAKHKALAQSTPDAAGLAERAEFAVPSALDAKARAAMAKMLAERKPDTPPPAQISAEFAAATAGYKAFIKARPTSALAGQALAKIAAVAVEYARIDAWDAAESVYADVLAAGVALHRPERMEFARAMCQIGKVLPDHARQVLAALTFTTPVRTGGEAGDVSVAVRRLSEASGFVADALWEENHRDDARRADKPPPADGPVSIAPPAPRTEAPAVTRGPAGGGAGVGGQVSAGKDLEATEPLGVSRNADLAALAAITQHEAQRAARVAQLREMGRAVTWAAAGQPQQQEGQAAAAPVLSDAELARIEGVFDAAYKALKAIRDRYPATITAEQARGEMLVLVSHWRTLAQWQRAAAIARRFVVDYPTDRDLPQTRLQIARDTLSWASQPPPRGQTRQDMLAEMSRRFDEARAQLAGVMKDFPDLKDLVRQAQWEIATSFLTQARAVDAISPVLSRGQYVRAARELQRLASEFAGHPNMATIPDVLWQIAGELQARRYFEEAIAVWTDLINYEPTHALSQQAAPLIAAAYRDNLNRPLRAVEVFLEINFRAGGNDAPSQNAVFEIGAKLKEQRRWVEALSVLETFADSFPRHPSAGQALAMVGQIHQVNEAWQDAIRTYQRVVNEYPSGNWVQEARWAIAECTINLSQWRTAMTAYEEYVQAYPKDGKVAEAQRRIGVLKDLARYQTLVDEANQRKSFDAQFQIARIVQEQLNNSQKAIIEYRKVTANWPASHLADDALYAVGSIYLAMGETAKARESFTEMALRYPDSNLADDAMLMVGRSYEEESQRLATLTRGATVLLAQEKAQKEAYRDVQRQRNEMQTAMSGRIAELRKGGKHDQASIEEATQAAGQFMFNTANIEQALAKAQQDVETLTAAQLADRQDKINAALRKAVEAYAAASRVPGGDKAGDALLRMAVIYDEQLKDSAAALATWKEIVNQFSGTAVAEEASWRIAQYHERAGNWADAVEAYKAFLRNYRRSPRAGQAQFAIAEGYEHLNKWVEAMDAYTNYLNNFADGPLAAKAREQINWIKTYRL